jgi:hypothetical protein
MRRGGAVAIARFLFVPGVAVSQAASARWPDEWDGVNRYGWTFAVGIADREDSSYGWRLLGPNNRELGRSPGVFRSLDECRAAVAALQADAADADVILTPHETTGLWTWRLDLHGRWVAVAGRAYQRRRECQYNVGQFVLTAPTAHASTGIVARGRMRQAGYTGAAL